MASASDWTLASTYVTQNGHNIWNLRRQGISVVWDYSKQW